MEFTTFRAHQKTETRYIANTAQLPHPKSRYMIMRSNSCGAVSSIGTIQNQYEFRNTMKILCPSMCLLYTSWLSFWLPIKNNMPKSDHLPGQLWTQCLKPSSSIVLTDTNNKALVFQTPPLRFGDVSRYVGMGSPTHTSAPGVWKPKPKGNSWHKTPGLPPRQR